jgi:6-pyruvoyltetrahydropterin/6-carboxytetrahydropterin synthase
MYLARDFYIEAAHHLENYEGKCKNIHGHSYKLRITIKGEAKQNGMIIDFGDFKKVVNDEVVNILDHANLNDYIKQPTVENLCDYVWAKLKEKLPLYEVKIWETRDCAAFTRGKDES